MQHRKIKIVHHLLQRGLAHGLDLNFKDILFKCTALHYCWYNGIPSDHENCYELSKILLQNGSDANAEDRQGTKSFHLILESSKVDVVKLFVQYGANVEIKNRKGTCALHFAARNQHLDVLRYVFQNLLEGNRGDLDAEDLKGESPLIHAAEVLHYKNCEYLVKCAADINKYGWKNSVTPLTVMYKGHSSEHIKIIQLLLEANVDLFNDNHGMNALERWANENVDPAIRRCLSRHLAKLAFMGVDVDVDGKNWVNNQAYREEYEESTRELGIMAMTIIHNDLPLVNILFANFPTLIGYARNEEFVAALKNGCRQDRFPRYYDAIQRRFNPAKKQVMVSTILSSTLGLNDPTHPVVIKIVKYLGTDEFEPFF